MQQLTETQANLLEGLLTFVFSCVLEDAPERQREWNALISVYGERIIPTLKDIAHHAGRARVIRAAAVREGTALDKDAYSREMVIAKSLAHGGAEDW